MKLIKLADLPAWFERGLIYAAILLFALNLLIALLDYYYRRKMGQKYQISQFHYSEEQMGIFRKCYNREKSIEGMLHRMIFQCVDEEVQWRMEMAILYLETDRYHDYETALYGYASDGTDACISFFRDLIEEDHRRRMEERLEMKENEEGE